MRANSDSARPRRARPDVGELVLALAVVAFGAAVVWQTTQIRVTPAYAQVGPRVIPYIVGVGLVLLGLWLTVSAVIGSAAIPSTESEDADATLPTDWLTVSRLAAFLVVYLYLLERVGFVVASSLLYVGAAFAMGSRKTERDVYIAFVLTYAIFLVFTEGLGLQLPEGVLEGFP